MKQAIDKFFSSGAYAIVGVSTDTKKFGNAAFRAMKEKGFTVFPVNPKRDLIGEDPCFASVLDLPDEVKAVVTVVPPAETEKVIHDCVKKGITAVWMQKGSESQKAIREAEESGIAVVHGQCIVMFLEPVEGFHSFHRWFTRLVGAYPG